MKEFSNMDLTNIVTPVNINKLVNTLRLANSDEAEIKFLNEGFSQGFDIGYDGPVK